MRIHSKACSTLEDEVCGCSAVAPEMERWLEMERRRVKEGGRVRGDDHVKLRLSQNLWPSHTAQEAEIITVTPLTPTC